MNKLLDAVRMSNPNIVKLSIIFGDNNDYVVIDTPSIYFNNTFEDSWLQDEFVKSIIKRIYNSDLQGNTVVSSVLGNIPIERIAGGTKACILMYETNDIIHASSCGDNCIPVIENILNYKPLVIKLCHWMEFSEGVYPIKCINSGKICNTRNELYNEYLKHR